MAILHMYLETIVEGRRYYVQAALNTAIFQLGDGPAEPLVQKYFAMQQELDHEIETMRDYLPQNKWPF